MGEWRAKGAGRTERGQAVPLMALVVVVVAVVALGVARLGRAAGARASAQTAADASALAGALDGEPGAREVATANGGRLVAFRQVGADVVVTVEAGGARAQARARPVGSSVAGVTVAGGFALPVPPSRVAPGAWGRPHHDYPALDLPVPTGTPVAALAGGRVRWVDDNRCGQGVSIDVASGVRYVYCHASGRSVPDGAYVTAGREVIRSGATGHVTGPHLHIGVFVDGVSVCPQPLLQALLAGRAPPPWRSLPAAGCSY